MSPASRSSLESSLLPLLSAFGPPGREAAVRAVLRRLLRGAGGTWAEDATGNLHWHRGGSGRRLLLTAHMDAPGVIVTRLEGEMGQARLSVLGGRRPAEWVGAPLRFEDGRAALVSWERKENAEPEAEQLLIETGIERRGGKASPRRAGGRARVNGAAPLDVGDVAAVDDRPVRLGDTWCAANLDDRAGCAVLVEVLTRVRAPRYDVHAVFTAQSDLGARGATTSTFGIDPELAVVVDVAHLGEPKETSGISMAKGPAVALKEQGFLAHPAMLETVRRAARAAGVPLQHLIRESEGSDARAVRATRAGVPTAVLAIPARRTGAIGSLVHARDLEQTAALLAALLSGASEGGGAKTRRTKQGGKR